jgi:hypothetical protein
MRKRKNLVGKKFGRLTVIAETDQDKNRNRRFICRCDCGKEVRVLHGSLTSGHTKSCGCLQKEWAETSFSDGRKSTIKKALARNSKEARKTTEHKKNVRRNNMLKRKYGITLDQYNEMHKKQNGRCAICGRNEKELGHVLRVDHHHGTCKVRKLLCIGCNTGIGNFQENPSLLQRAISYLGGL